MKTIKQVRVSFWEQHPQYKSEYRVNKRQNEYNCDIRMAFIDYVEFLKKDEVISNELAYKVTL